MSAPLTIAEKDAIDAAYREQNKCWDWYCARNRCCYTRFGFGLAHEPEIRVCGMCGKPNPKWLKMRAAMRQPTLF